MEETRREVERYENATVDPKEREMGGVRARRQRLGAEVRRGRSRQHWPREGLGVERIRRLGLEQMPIPSGWQHHGLNFSGVLVPPRD